MCGLGEVSWRTSLLVWALTWLQPAVDSCHANTRMRITLSIGHLPNALRTNSHILLAGLALALVCLPCLA